MRDTQTLGLEQSGLTSSNVVASDSPTGAWPNPSMTYTRQPGNEVRRQSTHLLQMKQMLK